MAKVFLKRGDFYSQTDGNFDVMPTLDNGIYQIRQNPVTGEIYLERIAEKFGFGFKLYGIDETLVSHVIDTYNKQEHKHNIGILLNGAKGTGKTVTAKVLCNKLGLPVIIIDGPIGGLSSFLASINHDCVFLFDEFEKNFRLKEDDEECAGESLLSIMDGVYNTNNCHIFILTTNELRVNDNLLSRPSRIRYLKSFGEVIDHKILEEYVEDNLKYKEYKDEIMDFIDSLTIATIDIVKSIVDEVNIHKCSVNEFKDFFNVKEATYRYSTRTYVIDKESNRGKDKITEEVFLEHAKAPYTKELDWRPDYSTVVLNKSIKKFKVGDYLTQRFRISKIDLRRGLVICDDLSYRNQIRYYFFEDIDEKPSIYEASKYTYGYDDYYC